MSTIYLLKVGGPVPQAGRYLGFGTGYSLLVATPHVAKAMQFRSKTTATRYKGKLLAILEDKRATLSVCRAPEAASFCNNDADT